jgi:hypothetical protein
LGQVLHQARQQRGLPSLRARIGPEVVHFVRIVGRVASTGRKRTAGANQLAPCFASVVIVIPFRVRTSAPV